MPVSLMVSVEAVRPLVMPAEPSISVPIGVTDRLILSVLPASDATVLLLLVSWKLPPVPSNASDGNTPPKPLIGVVWVTLPVAVRVIEPEAVRPDAVSTPGAPIDVIDTALATSVKLILPFMAVASMAMFCAELFSFSVIFEPSTTRPEVVIVLPAVWVTVPVDTSARLVTLVKLIGALTEIGPSLIELGTALPPSPPITSVPAVIWRLAGIISPPIPLPTLTAAPLVVVSSRTGWPGALIPKANDIESACKPTPSVVVMPLTAI